MALPPGRIISPAEAWGSIMGAVAGRGSTAQIWSAYRESVERLGGVTSPTAFAEITGLRSLAASIRNSSEVFAGMSDNQVITSAAIAQDIDSGPLNMQALVPVYKVTWEQHMIDPEGEEVSYWRTSYFPTVLPATKGDLLAELDAQGELMVAHGGVTYEGEHVGIGAVRITVV